MGIFLLKTLFLSIITYKIDILLGLIYLTGIILENSEAYHVNWEAKDNREVTCNEWFG